VADIPLKERWFDDFRVGERFEFGDYLVTADEIVEFAQRYDPQPFHLDGEAASRSHFGGLIASGWMSCAVLMRLVCDHFIPPASAMGSPGIDELRWLQPVRPGDRLRAAVEVMAVKASQSKPDRGVITAQQALINQHGERALTLIGRGMYRRRWAG